MYSAILAMDENNGIGKDNKLPWRLKKDMAHFKETTTGGIVLMGRKTYESIPEKFRPLPNRINIVLTRNKDYKQDGVIVINDIEEIQKLQEDKTIPQDQMIYVIGGAEIYKLFFKHPQLKEVILTKVHKSYDCDTFVKDSEFPQMTYTKSTLDHEDDGTVFEIIHYAVSKNHWVDMIV